MLGFHGHALQNDHIDLIKKSGQKTIIARLEALAILAGVELWLNKLRGFLVVIFCDNDSALASMSKVGSQNKFVFAVALLLAEHEFQVCDPSRQKCEHFDFACRKQVDFDALVKSVCERRDHPLM